MMITAWLYVLLLGRVCLYGWRLEKSGKVDVKGDGNLALHQRA